MASILARCAVSIPRSVLISLKDNSVNPRLGIQIAKRIEYFIRPRGSKGGSRHKRIAPTVSVSTQSQPIQTIVSQTRFETSSVRRPSALVPVLCQSTNRTKLKLNCALWNARSLSGKVGSIAALLAECRLDLFIVTETWLKSHDDPVISDITSAISGFSVIQKPRANRRGGGVAILCRTNLTVDNKTSHSFNSFESLDISVRSRGQLVRIIVIYRPPHSKKNLSTASDFLRDFSSLLEDVVPTPGRLLIAGDFNFHVDDAQSRDAAKFSDLLESCDLQQHVTTATHVRGHTLDLLITRADDNLVTLTEATSVLESDHRLIKFNVNITRPPATRTTRSFRNFKEIDRDALKSKLASSFIDFPKSSDVEELYDFYAKSMTSIIDQLAPVTSKTSIDKARAPWYTEELIDERRKVRQLERTWLSSKLTIDREIFVSKRSDYYRHVDEAKQNYHQTRIEYSDTAGLFRIVDELTGSKKANASIKPTNVSLSDLPNVFLNFFRDKVVNLKNGLTPQIEDSEPEAQSTLSDFVPISPADVTDLVNKSNSKSCNLDILPTDLLKFCINEMAPFLTYLFNASLVTGVVPQAFKTASVKPLLKKAGLDENLLKNYRPVSNLSFLSKCLERIVITQLNKYLSRYELYAKCQSAYRANHSCETALLRVQNDIMLALNDKKDVILVMLDLSAAFDTLDHDILLHRLKHRFGISGAVYDWFESYLRGRTHSVRLDQSNVSDESTVDCGVPQGTVCGPTLYSLYTAPLEDIIIRHRLDYMLFADDSQIYVVCKNPSDVTNQLETCVAEIREWMTSNLLILNEDKTEIIQFSARSKKDVERLASFCVGNSSIAPTDCVRNLGVYFDCDGLQTSNINQICKSAYYSLYRISKIRSLLDQKSCEKLIHAFVTSRVDYCNSILCGLSENDLRKLQSVQNSAARLVTKSKKFDHLQPIFFDLHWLSIHERIIFKVMLITFKIIQGECPQYLSELITPYVPTRAGLRSNQQFLLERRDTVKTSKTYGWRAFSVMAPRLWNDLPDYIRNCTSIGDFKSKLKTHLFKKQSERRWNVLI